MKPCELIIWASIAALCVGSTGCDTIWGKKLKAGYCADHASDSDCRSSFPDAADSGRCTSSATCMAPTAVCDIAGSMTCVQCIAPAETSACIETMPVCGADHACHPCSKHSDCALSNACLPDGSCALPSDVAYVQAGASGTMCTQMSPCGTLDAGVKASRPYVKVGAGTVADASGTIIDGKAVTILADPGAKLGRTVPGVILTVQNDGADVKIYDLQITGGTGLSNPAISIQSGGAPKLALTRVTIDGNQGVGISNASGGALRIEQSAISGNQGVGISNASSGALRIEQSAISGNQGVGISNASSGALRIEQSTISGNQGVGISNASSGALEISRSTISSNQDGGVQMNTNAVVVLTNNFVHHNGNDTTASFGGLSLRPASGSKVQFNTLVDNKANQATVSVGGIFCDVPGFVADENIVFRNTGGPSTMQQTLGSCAYGRSLIAAASAADNTPQFVHPNTPPFDYHLTADTPATIRDAAGVCSDVDFDGDARPAGSACDLGADEYRAGSP